MSARSGEDRMRIVLVGYGRMGRLVGTLAREYRCEVVGIVDPVAPEAIALEDERIREGDIAIDFTTADAVLTNVPALVRRGLDVVLGTTGWQGHEAALRAAVDGQGRGVVAAPNFSAGVVLFDALVARAAVLLSRQADFGAYIHEAHHAMKKDAPSGTALMLERSMRKAGYDRPIDMASTRAGHVPGTHTVGFDGPAESITLMHTARDRSAFARGALLAARWVKGRRGWFTMHDVLGLTGA